MLCVRAQWAQLEAATDEYIVRVDAELAAARRAAGVGVRRSGARRCRPEPWCDASSLAHTIILYQMQAPGGLCPTSAAPSRAPQGCAQALGAAPSRQQLQPAL